MAKSLTERLRATTVHRGDHWAAHVGGLTTYGETEAEAVERLGEFVQIVFRNANYDLLPPHKRPGISPDLARRVHGA